MRRTWMRASSSSMLGMAGRPSLLPPVPAPMRAMRRARTLAMGSSPLPAPGCAPAPSRPYLQVLSVQAHACRAGQVRADEQRARHDAYIHVWARVQLRDGRMDGWMLKSRGRMHCRCRCRCR